MYLDRQRYTVFWPYTICRPNTKTKRSRTRGHACRLFFGMYQLETRFARINNLYNCSQIENFPHTYSCEIGVILRSRVLRGVQDLAWSTKTDSFCTQRILHLRCTEQNGYRCIFTVYISSLRMAPAVYSTTVHPSNAHNTHRTIPSRVSTVTSGTAVVLY